MSEIIPLISPQKQCPRCTEWKPLTAFGADKYTRDGLTSSCKQCRKEAHLHPKEKPVIPDGYKWCPDCKNSFPATTDYFYRSRRRGLNQRCISCDKAQSKAYYQSHKEAHNRHTHEYYRTHKEAIIANNRRYAQSHVQRMREHRQAWKRANPLKVRVLTQKRWAQKKAVAGSYTSEQIQEQLKRQKFCCYYAACGYAKFERKNERYIYHVEHTYPLNRVAGSSVPANDMSYIVLACPSCNQHKNDRFPWEWPEGGRLL